MLLADAARSTSAALHRYKQHDHAENIAEHGGGGLRLHVTLPPRRQRVDRLLPPRRRDHPCAILSEAFVLKRLVSASVSFIPTGMLHPRWSRLVCRLCEEIRAKIHEKETNRCYILR